jgi:hypothetical protein
MNKLSREKLEQLMQDKSVVNTKIEENKKELRIYLVMADGQRFVVKYDRVNQSKSYFLDKESPNIEIKKILE